MRLTRRSFLKMGRRHLLLLATVAGSAGACGPLSAQTLIRELRKGTSFRVAAPGSLLSGGVSTALMGLAFEEEIEWLVLQGLIYPKRKESRRR